MPIKTYTRIQISDAQSILEHRQAETNAPDTLDISALPTRFHCEIFIQSWARLTLADLDGKTCRELHGQADVMLQPLNEDDFDAGTELLFLDHPLSKTLCFGDSSEGVVAPDDDSMLFCVFVTLLIEEGFIFNVANPITPNTQDDVVAEFISRCKADASV